jgi:sarcosine oxidase delta subunit
MDYISREDAIKAWKEDFKSFVSELLLPRDDYKGIMEYIDECPAADVVERELDEWCYDCKEYDSNKHNCPRFRRVIRDTVDECKAINVERKSGKWIDSYDLSGNHYKRCSECGAYIEATFFANDYSVIFCPHCGADNREENRNEGTYR